jgi:assimilatory nitrate reductase catalytic subunit
MRTHCPYCALQCAMTIEERDGAYAAAGDPAFDVNAGELCMKGFSAAETLAHPDRLLTPLVRRDGRLEPATWDEALDAAANGFARVAERHGPDAVATFGSGSLTNEKAYALGKFARLALGTANFDYNGRFCMSSAAAAANRSLGLDRGLPFPLAWIAEADTLLVAGGNPLETMPPLERYFTHQRSRSGASIVIDPRVTRFAAQATLHLQPAPSTDTALAYALLHVLVAERFIDEEYIGARTRGFDDVRRSAEREHPERAERRTGVAADDIRTAARLLAAPGRSIVLTGRGIEQHSNGTDCANAFINLALALGLPGRKGCGYGTITGQGNGQGGREHGQKSDQLPGYGSVADRATVERIARVWNVAPQRVARRGMTAGEILAAIGDRIHALFVMGSNPAVCAPDGVALREKLTQIEHLVVCDFFLSETAAHAHVVLPVLQWAEETGTTTNLEGRVLLREQCVPAPSGPRSDLAVLCELAPRLGTPLLLPSAEPQAVFDELRRASAGGRADYSGITYARLRKGERLAWPVPAVDHPGTPALFALTFPTADGRAAFIDVSTDSADETPDAQYPWTLTTGRVREHYNSGTQTRRVARLAAAIPEPFAEIHPTLAAHIGIVDGDMMRISSRRASVSLRARITETIRPELIFAPFHWGGNSSINAVTGGSLDPFSKMPPFKMCAVKIEAVVSPS